MELADPDFSLQGQSAWMLVVRWGLTFSPVLPCTVATVLLASQAESIDEGRLLVWLELVSALICTLLIGLSQRAVLHRYASVGQQWVLATASGVSLLVLLGICASLVMTITTPGSRISGIDLLG